MKGNRYVPSFMLSVFVEEPDEEKKNDNWSVRKRKTEERTAEELKAENKGRETSNKQSNQWHKLRRLDSNLWVRAANPCSTGLLTFEIFSCSLQQPDLHGLLGPHDGGDIQATIGHKFEAMLKTLSFDRDQIKNAMKFALDNADSTGEIAEILTKSLGTKERPCGS